MATGIIKDLGSFAAAHQLPTHHGKCSNLHGHNYRVEIYLEGSSFGQNAPRQQDPMLGPRPSSYGMLIDFGDVKKVYKDLIEQHLDHSLLLGTLPLEWFDKILNDETLAISPAHEKTGLRVGHHHSLGKVCFLPIHVTTAELMAEWMANVLFPEFCKVQSTLNFLQLKIWETETGCGMAEVYR